MVSVVIPVRDDAAGLPHAVDSVLAQTVDAELEVLLCVGPSSDGTEAAARALAARDPRVKVIGNPTGQIPTALNLGLRAAAGTAVVRVDARAVLPAGYIARGLASLRETGAANVGAVQKPVGHTRTQRAIATAMAHPVGSGGAAYRRGGALRRVDTAFLGIFDTAALRSAGGWNNNFLRNEDAELNLRLADRGGVWLDPRLVVEYQPRKSLRRLARQYFDYGWWRRETIRRHPGSFALRQFAAPAVVVVLAASLVAGALTPWALLVPVGYGAAMLAVGASTPGPIAERMLTGASLATMHVAWGSGFVANIAKPAFGRDKPT